MPEGIFLIKWDDILGGTIHLKYPEDLEIPEPVVQQIQISHDFVESNITIKEKDWNSVSYYNEAKQIITVLILDKYADSSDYIELIENFNEELDHTSDEELMVSMQNIVGASVFRTRDEVISKLSNQVAELKMWEYDMTKKLEAIANLDFLDVKARICYLLTINEHVSLIDMKKTIKTSSQWLSSVLKTLVKNNIIGYDGNKDHYFLRY